MKQFDEHLCKFTIDDETIKAEIKISDLCKLFNEAPTNFDYDHPICRVRNPQKGEEIEGVYWRLDVAEESIRQSKECHNDIRNFRIEKQDVWSK